MMSLLLAAAAIVFLLGPIALFVAMSHSGRLDRLGTRLFELEQQQRELMREIDRLTSVLRGQGGTRPAETGGTAAAASDRPKAAGVAAVSQPVASSVPIASPASMPDAARVAPASAPATAGGDGHAGASGDPSSPEPQHRPGLEERLGTRWAVWVGGVALALGALLLVRYSIEQGLLGPGVRLLLGALLSLALLYAGERLRRGEAKLDTDVVPAAHIPGVLTAAGTVAAFGTVYAAHALYGYIGSGLAFALLSLIGLGTLMASSVHGPALAGIGLAASFLTPMLVSTETPNPWPLVVYLAVVSTASYALARMKGWRWLVAATAAGSGIWALVLATEASADRAWIAPTMLNVLLQLGLAVFWLAPGSHTGETPEDAEPDRDASVILGAWAAISAFVLLANQGVSPASVLFTAAAMGLLMLAGLRYVPAASSVGAAGGLALAGLLIWPSASGSRHDLWTAVELDRGLFTDPLNTLSFASLAFLAAIAVAGLCAQRLLTSQRLQTWSAAWYAGTAAVVPLLALVIAYLRIAGVSPSPAFALAAFAAASLFAFGMLAFEAREKELDTSSIRLGTGAFASAAVAAGSLGLVFQLERGYLTVALAIAALAAAYMADHKSIPALRKAVMALGAVVLARVVWDPRIMGEHLGQTPIFNWLLIGYGVPALSFYGAARYLERTADDDASRFSDALAVLFAGLLAFFQIRHFMHGGDILAPSTDHAELGLMLVVALAFAYALLKGGLAKASPVFRYASFGFGGLAAAATMLGLLIGENPLFVDDPVASRGPFDTLWLGYLAPALAAALIQRHARGIWPRPVILMAAGAALALIFMFVTLEVRHAFHGASLGHWHPTSDSEYWTYSVAWLLLGVALLGYGLWREMPEARLASAAIVVLTVLKVFLLDMSGLEGALRAFSFIGLGLALVGIGLVYQRYIFGAKRMVTGSG